MSFVPRHNQPVPARVKAARHAAVGVTTALVGSGVALGTTGSAHAAAPADGSVWDRVAACESSGNWGINTGNGFSGGLQFTPSTWRAFGGSGSAHNASRSEQIAVAKRVLKAQGPGAWPVCSRKAGLTRGNGGSASSYSVSSSRSHTRHSISHGTSHRSSGTSHTTHKTYKKTYTHSSTKRAGATTYTPRHAAHTSVGTTSTPRVFTRYMGARSVNVPAQRHKVLTVQRELGVAADGTIGAVTSRAIQKLVGVSQDGIIGPITVRAIEDKVGLSHSGAYNLRPSRLAGLVHYLLSH